MVRSAMPSSAGRHALRQNLRQAQHRIDNDREGNNLDEHGVMHANGNAGNASPDRRTSFSSTHFSDEEKKTTQPTLRHSNSLVDALSDSNSELAHFLLASKENQGDDDDGLFDNVLFNNSLVKSFRNMATRLTTGEDEVREVGSMGTNKAWFYSLALEPMEVRRERIIMLAEAYAIFGALFLGGTWVLYEWGSSFGYGGCMYEETSYCHPAVDRAFEAVMTMAITANLFQAMFASFLWLMSILFSGSHHNWVYGARHLLAFCHLLLTCVFVLTVVSVGLGIYSKLAPYWPELAICMAFLLSTVVYGMWTTSDIAADQISLEYYHFPLWFKWGIFPYPMLRRGGRQKIREAAEKRAKDLKARAYKERTMLSTDSSTARSRRTSRTSVGDLLRRAADSIGRVNFDVSKYEERLEEDWYMESSELRNMSVDVLSRYMPRRLAEEVHNQLATEDVTTARTASIGRGVFGDEEHEPHVSWNLTDDSD